MADGSGTKADMAQITCETITRILRERHWQDVKISHYRFIDEDGTVLVDTAVEVGYVYGECTVRFNRLEGNVDKGTYMTERGVGQQFVLQIFNLIAGLEAGAR